MLLCRENKTAYEIKEIFNSSDKFLYDLGGLKESRLEKNFVINIYGIILSGGQ